MNFLLVHRFLLILSLAWIFGKGNAQTPGKLQPHECYQKLVEAARQSVSNKDYGLAINQYWAAYTCDYPPGNDSLAIFINEVVKILEVAKAKAEAAEKAAREKSIIAENLAREAQAEREKAKLAEKNARQSESKARTAKKQLESMLLSTLANTTREEGQKEGALLLAYAGLKLSDNNLSSEGKRAFGQAVSDSLSSVLFQAPPKTRINNFKLLPQNTGAVVQADKKLHLVPFNGQNHTTITPLKITGYFSFELSHNGKIIAIWSDNQQVEVWSSDGSLLHTFSLHTNRICGIRFSPDDQYIISFSRDHTAILVDLNSESTTLLKSHQGNIYDIQFSPDGQRFFTRSSDGSIRVWNTSGQLLAALGENEIYIHHATFSHKGDHIITASANGYTKIWDLKGQSFAQLNGHGIPIRKTSFIGNDEMALIHSLKKVLLWNLKEGNTHVIHQGNMVGMTINEQENKIATWDTKYQLKLSDPHSNSYKELKGLKTAIINVAFSPTEEYLVSTTQNGIATLWDFEGNVIIHRDLHNSTPIPSVFSEDGQYLITLEQEGTLLTICPLPNSIYQSIDTNIDAWSDKLHKLEQAYNLRFIEGILRSHSN